MRWTATTKTVKKETIEIWKPKKMKPTCREREREQSESDQWHEEREEEEDDDDEELNRHGLAAALG